MQPQIPYIRKTRRGVLSSESTQTVLIKQGARIWFVDELPHLCRHANSADCVFGQVVVGVTLAVAGQHAWVAWFVVVVMCIYVGAYAASWGPLGWLYPSEVSTYVPAEDLV